jgi:hypothetical protein
MDDLKPGSSSVGELARELEKIGEGAFRRKYPHPFLVEVYRPEDDFEDDEYADTGEVPVIDFSQEVSKWMIMKAVVVAGSGGGDSGPQVSVGRSKSSDIVLRGSKISKQHAGFYRDGGQWQLMDLGSMNGTAVNGNQLKANQKASIKSKDVISFWRYAFEFHQTDSFIDFLFKVVLRRNYRRRK